MLKHLVGGFENQDSQIVSEYHPTGKGKCTFTMKKFGRHQLYQGIKTNINTDGTNLLYVIVDVLLMSSHWDAAHLYIMPAKIHSLEFNHEEAFRQIQIIRHSSKIVV